MQADIAALSLPRKTVDELLWLSTFSSMKHLSNVSSTDTMSGIRNMGSNVTFSLFFLFSLYGIKLCPLKARSSGMWVGYFPSLDRLFLIFIYREINLKATPPIETESWNWDDMKIAFEPYPPTPKIRTFRFGKVSVISAISNYR